MSKNHQQRIGRFFPKQAIAYQPGLSLAFKSLPVGILLSQLLYWHDLGSKPDGWVYKTMTDLKKETGLTRAQQETAIKKCVGFGVIDYKLAGIPATRHFRVNMEALENLLPSLKEKAGIVYRNLPPQFAGNQQSITKNTQKTTTLTTKESFKPNIGGASSIGHQLQAKYGYLPRKSNDFGKERPLNG